MKDNFINVRFSAEQAGYIKDSATKLDISTSAFIRMIIADYKAKHVGGVRVEELLEKH